jgi:hypothetical protein
MSTESPTAPPLLEVVMSPVLVVVIEPPAPVLAVFDDEQAASAPAAPSANSETVVLCRSRITHLRWSRLQAKPFTASSREF